ncbi:MAG TPA: VWA domain-containing protein [Gemmatimonadales bacterium]|jgi:Ca-activated chloride channel family protein|nr:VWA domain-containing protein [Gemmatimonadales bacterium]
MTFDTPLLLPLAPVLAGAVGAGALWARSRRIRRAARWSSDLALQAKRGGLTGPILLGLAGLVAGIALAGPRGGRAEVTSQTRALSVVFAVDISRSMLAEDAAPSRLGRAVRETRRLVQDLAGDRLGLIAFAGRSYILTPLTVDGGAVSLFLDGLDPDLASQGGTGLSNVLAQGGELLTASKDGSDRVLVLFTDGEAHDTLTEILARAKELNARGVRLILVAEGGTTPTRIPVRDSAGALIEYQMESPGHPVQTYRRDDILQAIADAAEGTLVPAELPDQAGAVRDLIAAFKRSPAQETMTSDLLPQTWIPMTIALLLLLIQTLTRRSAALVGLAGLLMLARAEAQVPSRGTTAAQTGRFSDAARAFLEDANAGAAEDTAYYDAGTAALSAGQFDLARKALTKASASLDPSLRYRALYNLGVNDLLNAAADSGHAEAWRGEAAKHLQEALLLQPKSQRAKWNLELARRQRPPPPGGASSPPPPPSTPPPPRPQSQEQRPLSANQAEQILNSVEREEQETRAKHVGRVRNLSAGEKDW